MFSNRTVPLLLLILVHLVLPAGLILWFWLGQSPSQFRWLISAIFMGTFVLTIYFIGFWRYLSVYLSYLWIILFVAAGIVSYLGVRELPFFVQMDALGWIRLSLDIVFSLVFVYIIVGAIGAYFYPARPINLEFPFRNGVYSINWGGNGASSRLMNYHYTGSMHEKAGVNRPMKYAVDIEKVNILGSSSWGILPTKLERYVSYHQDILSPCDGSVVEVVEGLPNEGPFSGHYPYNVGNHVVIMKDSYQVLLGHLQSGSIKVKVGDKVKTGDVLGQVGNSGMTDAPHTHVHAMKVTGKNIWLEEGIPIYFDGENPVKNTLFIKR
jgi:Peptidase family M23